MKYSWKTVKAKDFISFNPRIPLRKEELSKKISMDKLQPYSKIVSGFEWDRYKGGAKFSNGDTIMARITPCLENGKTAYVDFLDDDEVAFGSTEFIVLRAKEGISDPQFIYYTAINPSFRSIAIQSMVGSSGRQRVQQGVLNNTMLYVPDLPIQRKIGSFLHMIDSKIVNNQKINDKLQHLVQIIYSDMFLNNPEHVASEGRLSDIAIITMGQSPKGSSYNEVGDGKVFYQGRTDFGSRFPSRRLFTTEPKRIAEEGDVLLSVRAPVGDINVANEQCCIGRGLGAIHSKHKHSSFVLYTMLSLRPMLEVFNGTGTIFGSINKDALNDLPIMVPPDEAITQFEDLARPIDNLIKVNTTEMQRLQSLRDLLIPKFLSGEIDLSEVSL